MVNESELRLRSESPRNQVDIPINLNGEGNAIVLGDITSEEISRLVRVEIEEV